ncbi:hypothetical protein BX600DRAFT_118804 [Xylariales sp. PMI_506]|nr:hypothetical protein BX600DRAFT_118804 [Xylariales sp. PMI_506]
MSSSVGGSISDGPRTSFFPKAEAAVLQTKHGLPQSRPGTVGPVFDTEHVDSPLAPWSSTFACINYPPKDDDYAPATIPARPADFADRYLYPVLTRNERLRLTMLWYYTRGLVGDQEFLSRLQEKTYLVQESIGWEFAIVGLLDLNTYQRLATYGLPLAILPRRESTCAHTVNQPPGTVFLLPNMVEDWRFQQSPHVEIGGLRSYAGVPLRFETEFGDCVAFGSICVASNTAHETLSKDQSISLTRLADWVVTDIIQSSRIRRQRERRRLDTLIATAQKKADAEGSEEPILDILRTIYPHADIGVQCCEKTLELILEGREPILPSDLDNGLWEDVEYIDYIIDNWNCQELPTTRVVRVIAAPCEGTSSVPSFLVVASKDMQMVFDDIDFWFVQTCAGLISRLWNNRLLTEALLAKEKFLRGITHQLRTPIHGILGSTELLTEVLKSPPPGSRKNSTSSSDSYGIANSAVAMLAAATDAAIDATTAHLDTENCSNPFVYLDTIKTAAQDLITIVNSMITLNRWADVARTTRADALHSIRELEEELLSEISTSRLRDGHRTPSIFFHHNLPQHCDCIWVDFNLLKNSLLPLILNALQHTRPGGIVKITSSVALDGEELVFDVEDSGCGIQNDDQRRIFDAFEKVDVHSTGAGLGLTLASKFAELLGGSVTLVSSVVDRGSTFRATFRDFACACSLHASPPPKEDQQLQELQEARNGISNGGIRLTYCRLPPPTPDSDGGIISLGEHFAKYIEGHGYLLSTLDEASLVLLDCARNSEQCRAYCPQSADNQVVVCLTPTTSSGNPPADPEDKTLPKNIIYATGPFTTSTLQATLEAAESLLTQDGQPTMKSSSAVDTDTTPQTLESGDHESLLEQAAINGASPLAATPTEISAQSDDNQSTVVLAAKPSTLPPSAKQLSIVETSVIVPILSPLDARSPSLPSRPAAALLVDDNVVNLRILQMYCNKRGLPYLCATDGKQAVEIFARHQSALLSQSSCSPTCCSSPTTTTDAAVAVNGTGRNDDGHGGTIGPIELILMDLQMPVCDGIEATRQIRRLEEQHQQQSGEGGRPHRSVLFIVTGQDSPRDRADAESAGADDFFVKPVGVKVLDRGVGRYFPGLARGASR